MRCGLLFYDLNGLFFKFQCLMNGDESSLLTTKHGFSGAQHLYAEAPFVIVPRQDFDHVAIRDFGERGIKS
jgi:hypothetical protein